MSFNVQFFEFFPSVVCSLFSMVEGGKDVILIKKAPTVVRVPGIINKTTKTMKTTSIKMESGFFFFK